MVTVCLCSSEDWEQERTDYSIYTSFDVERVVLMLDSNVLQGSRWAVFHVCFLPAFNVCVCVPRCPGPDCRRQHWRRQLLASRWGPSEGAGQTVSVTGRILWLWEATQLHVRKGIHHPSYGWDLFIDSNLSEHISDQSETTLKYVCFHDKPGERNKQTKKAKSSSSSTR